MGFGTVGWILWLVSVVGTAEGRTFDQAQLERLLQPTGESFVVEHSEAAAGRQVFVLRSARPVERTASGPIFLRARLVLSMAATPLGASGEVERRLAAADPDVGLSYSWDFVTAAGRQVAHLQADCTFSEESFTSVARELAEELPASQSSFWCRCGDGCLSGVPFDAAPPRLAGRRAEARTRPAGRDTRLDPSGSWSSPTGDLSLLLGGETLAFSYLAVFGKTAHICQGAGLAEEVDRNRYAYSDGQGTVVFAIGEPEVRLELVDGIASFCGAGWTGDRFDLEGHRPPTNRVVIRERSLFHRVDALEPKASGRVAIHGETVEVVPAPHAEDGAWLLARSAAAGSSVFGLLKRTDVGEP